MPLAPWLIKPPADPPLVEISAFEQKLQAFLEYAVSLAKDGLSWSDAWDLVSSGITFAVEAAKELTAEGANKKALVMQAVTVIFDAVSVYLPWYARAFAWFFRDWILSQIDGQVESMYDRLVAPTKATAGVPQ